MRAFTANPSLMKAGAHFRLPSYACKLVESVSDRHISFEVLSDGVAEMVAQARVINAWGGNAPITVSAVSPWRQHCSGKRACETAGDDDARRAAFQCRARSVA